VLLSVDVEEFAKSLDCELRARVCARILYSSVVGVLVYGMGFHVACHCSSLAFTGSKSYLWYADSKVQNL
jgi:hypothetical protein